MLGADQGPCTYLDEAACKADPRCQQLYVGTSFLGELVAEQCVLLEPGRRVDAPCETLSRDACRTRNDCSLIYWQDLGPDDGPIGRPYYKRCASEDMVELDLDDR